MNYWSSWNEPSDYGWIITKDYLYPEKKEGVYSGPGEMGPGDIKPEHEAALKAGKGTAFMMYDDDGELYYRGKIVGDFEGFEPLDDYGTPNAGCTGIKYKSKAGPWTWL